MEKTMCQNLSGKSNRHTRPHKNLRSDPTKESVKINSAMDSADEDYYICKVCGTSWLHETGAMGLGIAPFYHHSNSDNP